MSRLLRLGVGPLPGFCCAEDLAGFAFAALARPSRRFFSVAERSEPLKTCAWSLFTASMAFAGVSKIA